MPKEHGQPNSTEPTRGAWQRPETQPRTLPDGRKVPTYVCRYCRDVGLIRLPKPHDGETDAELIGLHVAGDGHQTVGIYPGKTYAQYCPACRSVLETAHSARSRAQLAEHQLRRLSRWQRAMTDWLDDQTAKAYLGEHTFPADVGRIGRSMPQLPGWQQDQIAEQARRAAQ